MAKLLTVLVILGKILFSIQQEDHFVNDPIGHDQSDEENPSYSFGYGVSDMHTGDVKTVWEDKQGDNVRGHYSVIEPDGSMRTVEYSAGPDSGFTAMVDNDGIHEKPTADEDVMEDKALRDFERYYDFLEEGDSEALYPARKRKRNKHPYESLFKDYALMKRPKYPVDLEPSEYTHSFTINHPHGDLDSEATAQSHFGFKFDPNCKTKHKKKNNNYDNVDLDFERQKYPSITSDSYNNDYEKYIGDSSSMDKLIQMYKHNEQSAFNKPSKPDEYNSWSSTKHNQGLSDAPLEDSYSYYVPPRPKQKYKPHKTPEIFEAEDLDDYVLVPKKKHKKPFRFVKDSSEYQPDDEGYDDSYDDRYHKPPRPTQKEVVRKIVKKTKPAINLLDIFDI